MYARGDGVAFEDFAESFEAFAGVDAEAGCELFLAIDGFAAGEKCHVMEIA